MPFYAYAWLGSMVSGIFVVLAKLTSKYSISNPWLFNFFLYISILIFLVPIALINKAGMPTDWLPIILNAVFYTLFYTTWVFATYSMDVTTLIPLYNFRSIFTIFFGVIFFAEHFLPTQFIYIIIIIIAGIFTSMDEKFNIKAFFNKNILIVLASVIFLALENVFVKLALVKNNFWTMNMWVAILAFILLHQQFISFIKNSKK